MDKDILNNSNLLETSEEELEILDKIDKIKEDTKEQVEVTSVKETEQLISKYLSIKRYKILNWMKTQSEEMLEQITSKELTHLIPIYEQTVKSMTISLENTIEFNSFDERSMELYLSSIRGVIQRYNNLTRNKDLKDRDEKFYRKMISFYGSELRALNVIQDNLNKK